MTTVHDLKDLVMIYHDCDKYKVSVWNPEEQTEMNICFCGSSKPCEESPDGQINFIVTYKNNNDNYVFMKAFEETLKSMEKNGLDMGIEWKKIFLENMLRCRNNIKNKEKQ